MEEKTLGAAAAATTPESLTSTTAKVQLFGDIGKVYDYFFDNVGTSLDCALATGILRNCVTWYIQDLEEMCLLQAIIKRPDRNTHFKAKHYSADPTKWVAPVVHKQLSLF